MSYNLPKYTVLEKTLSARYGAIKPLCEYGQVVCGPFGSEITSKDYVENGIPLLRITNITKDGSLLLDEVKFVSDELSAHLSRTTVTVGDLVISQRGTLGQCAIVTSEYPKYNISANIIAVKNIGGISPKFLRNYISSETGGEFLQRAKSGQVQGKITTEDIAALPIPLPKQQNKLNDIISTAMERRTAALREADALLAGMSEFVCNELGISLPTTNPKLGIAVTMRQLRADNAFNVEYYHPERVSTITAIKQVSYRFLKDCVSFNRDIVTATGDKYLGLAGVQSDTGELSGAIDEAAGQAFAFCENDVLYCRLRPYLNKVWKAEHGGVCSTEFHVMRIKSGDVLPDYLAAVMRSTLVLRQTKHMMTGNTHPRISNDDLANLLIPVPDKNVQQKITAEMQKRQQTSRVLRSEVEADWAAARARFERELLGGTGK